MHIVKISPQIKTPKRGTPGACGYDIYMPEDGVAYANQEVKVGLGFHLALPPGYCALILPRSGVGTKSGLELNNTCGVIDEDYRGEWMAVIKLKRFEELRWKKDERLLQFVVVPVLQEEIHELDHVQDLPVSQRLGGFGSTGK